jgi:DNA-binding HxlR family transcriptional regulator
LTTTVFVVARSPGSYGSFCPVSKAAEVVCQRWTPLILRELLVGSSRFNEIHRGVPTCSPSLLSKRLRELESAGVVEHDAKTATYVLTEAGRDLLPVILGLGEWGQRWARSEYHPEELDPEVLLWDVRRYLRPGGLGAGRVVVLFEFPAMKPRKRYYWVVDDGREVDVCLVDPGMGVDVEVSADLRALTRVWMGDESFEGAERQGSINVRGPRRYSKQVPGWFGQHPVLSTVSSKR